MLFAFSLALAISSAAVSSPGNVRDSLMLLFTNPFLVDLARLIAEDKSAEIATWNPE
jgi:hypothetical protein